MPPSRPPATNTNRTPYELLTSVHGVGPKTTAALLSKFRTITTIATADAQQLQAVQGVTPEIARSVQQAAADHVGRQVYETTRQARNDPFDLDQPLDLPNIVDHLPTLPAVPQLPAVNLGRLQQIPQAAAAAARRRTTQAHTAAQRAARRVAAATRSHLPLH